MTAQGQYLPVAPPGSPSLDRVGPGSFKRLESSLMTEPTTLERDRYVRGPLATGRPPSRRGLRLPLHCYRWPEVLGRQRHGVSPRLASQVEAIDERRTRMFRPTGTGRFADVPGMGHRRLRSGASRTSAVGVRELTLSTHLRHSDHQIRRPKAVIGSSKPHRRVSPGNARLAFALRASLMRHVVLRCRRLRRSHC